jgi:hypothetical protein
MPDAFRYRNRGGLVALYVDTDLKNKGDREVGRLSSQQSFPNPKSKIQNGMRLETIF